MAHFRMYCEICGFNTVVADNQELKFVEYKRSQVQGKLPSMDENFKIAKGEFLPMPKKYKCPKCGRLLAGKKKVKEIKDEVKTKNPDEQDYDTGNKGGFERL